MRIGRTVASLSRMEATAVATVILMICAIWLRYDGIVHDAILYTLQALNAVDPGRYGKDVFLAYGSQDQFTLFSPIYGSFIRWIGLTAANAVLYVVGVVLWLIGAAALSRSLRIPAWLMVVLVVILPMPYGAEVTLSSGESVAIFHDKEPFLTPRLYAEALSLIGISLMVEGKRYWALVPVLLGFILHPVMGLAALLMGYIYETVRSAHKWRWLVFAASAVILVITVGALGISPANRLFVVVQGAWLQAVSLRSRAGTTGWGNGYWQLIFTASLTATLLLDRRAMVKQLGLATLIASAIGLLADYIGWSLLHSELILQVQPWRAIWVLTVIARFALASLLIGDDDPQSLKRSAFWIFLVAIGLAGWLQAIGGLLGLAVAIMEDQVRQSGPVSQCRQTIRLASIVLSWVLFVLSSLNALHYVSNSGVLSSCQQLEGALITLFVMTPPLLQRASNVAFAIGLAVLLPVFRRPRRSIVMAPIAAMMLLMSVSGALLFLNGQAIKGARLASRVQPLAGALTRPGDIYWEEYPDQIWFGLGRTSYLSIPQQNVVAFSENAALEVVRRARHLRTTGAPESGLRFRVPWTSFNHPWAPNALPQLCADSTIAYVIAERQPYRAMASFTDIGNTPEQFFIYDCAALTPE